MRCRVAATAPRLPEATDPSGFLEIFNGGHVDPHVRARPAKNGGNSYRLQIATKRARFKSGRSNILLSRAICCSVGMSYLPFARVQDAKSKHGAGMNLGRRLLEKILCGGSGSWAAAGVAARPVIPTSGSSWSFRWASFRWVGPLARFLQQGTRLHEQKGRTAYVFRTIDQLAKRAKADPLKASTSARPTSGGGSWRQTGRIELQQLARDPQYRSW